MIAYLRHTLFIYHPSSALLVNTDFWIDGVWASQPSQGKYISRELRKKLRTTLVMCLQPVSCKIDGHHNGHHTHDDVDQGPEELDFVWYDFSRLFPVTH